jgi:hypothetical protein
LSIGSCFAIDLLFKNSTEVRMILRFKNLGLFLVAVGLMACQGGGSGGGSAEAVDPAKLNGTWEVTYYNYGDKFEAKTDGSGYLIPLDKSHPETVYAGSRIFKSFDGSQMTTTNVGTDKTSWSYDPDKYQIDGNFLVYKHESEDGHKWEERFHVTRLTTDNLEMSDYGNTMKLKKVTGDAIARATEVYKPEAYKPEVLNVKVGQVVGLTSDIILDKGVENFFVNGNKIKKSRLLKMESQDYCSIGITPLNSLGDIALPKRFQTEEKNILPKEASPYTLEEISHYNDSVYLKGTTPSSEHVDFLIYCGKIMSGEESNKEQTSIEAIQKHFAGLLSFK